MLGQQAKETSSTLFSPEIILTCRWPTHLTANHFFDIKISNIPVKYAHVGCEGGITHYPINWMFQIDLEGSSKGCSMGGGKKRKKERNKQQWI